MEDNSQIAKQRAKMPDGTQVILNSRTLASAHRRLMDLLQPGMTVLDIGCGTGAITNGIAKLVGSHGKVVGIDSNIQLIEEAKQKWCDLANLTFEVGDIYNLNDKDQFDIVTCSRVLQWLSSPKTAVRSMINAVKEGGQLVILDYNHEKIEWQPKPPESMQRFYNLFLKWRRDAGMDNHIADHLETIFQEYGLNQIHVSPQHEESKRSNIDFESKVGIWADVAASRGHQLVQEHYLSEQTRLMAETEYRRWVSEEAIYMKMYLLAVSGSKIGIANAGKKMK